MCIRDRYITVLSVRIGKNFFEVKLMYNKKTIEDIDCKGKRVLVRCDFNVPMKDGVITDNKRIVEALPTIKYLSSNGAKLILCSHFGRPKGEFNKTYSLAPCLLYTSCKSSLNRFCQYAKKRIFCAAWTG